jgi:hypothetical protein
MCCVKFGFQFLLPLFYFQQVYFILCCNLIASKEIHKVVKYLGVGNRDFNSSSNMDCHSGGYPWQNHGTGTQW